MTSMSGIKVRPDVATLFNEVKLKKTHKFVGFKITDNKKEVIIDEDFSGDPCDTKTAEEDRKCFEDFKQRVLSCSYPRYLLYDFQFTSPEGRLINKIAFFSWSRDDSPVGQKMIYSSTKDTVKKIFKGISLEFQVNEPGDLDYESHMAEVLKKA